MDKTNIQRIEEMNYEEMEQSIPCENAGFVPLDTNGRILFEILKELKKLNDSIEQWDRAYREGYIWRSK